MEILLSANIKVQAGSMHMWALIIGAIFVLFALIISGFLIFQHLQAYNNPAEQKWIICVLFIVPIYAIESILSLWKHSISVECDILRNCYEAFALYSFGNYLIACLGGEDKTIEYLESKSANELNVSLLRDDKKEAVKHPFPLNTFIKPWTVGEEFYRLSKFGIVQYMILKSACAFIALILELCGVYGNGEFRWYYGYPYITVVLNFSQTWALYCLVQFYYVTHQALQSIRPLAKFVSFKAIVFATWWQGVAIVIICSLLFKKDSLPEGAKTGLQDFLICVEMTIAAVAHIFAFPAEPYRCLQRNSSEELSPTLNSFKADIKYGFGKGADEEPAVFQKIEEDIESPRTSIKESVQDVVIGGGEHVMHDVLVTMSQAVEPVEKGVTKLNERLHYLTRKDKDEDKEEDLIVDEKIIETEDHEKTLEIDEKITETSATGKESVAMEKHAEKHSER